MVQQGEPQQILLEPADAYIEDFVNDINRARVLRVRSVMRSQGSADLRIDGEVDQDDTLESVIALSQGDTNLNYRVMNDARQVGVLDMKDLVRALVPRVVGTSTQPQRARPTNHPGGDHAVGEN